MAYIYIYIYIGFVAITQNPEVYGLLILKV